MSHASNRKCSGCGLVLEPEKFGKGLSHYCLLCRKVVSKRYRQKNREVLCARQRTYYHANKEKCNDASRQWLRTDSGRAHLRIRSRRGLIDCPEKARARGMVRYNVWLGKIKKPESCESCGATGVRICGHHHNGYDLEHRYDVRWLCDKCHREEHKTNLGASYG